MSLTSNNTTTTNVMDDENGDFAAAQESTLSNIGLPLSVAIVGLSVGLSLQVQDFTHLRKEPGPAALGVLCQLVLVPAVGWLLTTAFDLQDELAVGMVLLTLCPGGSSSNYVSVVAGGDGALSVSLTAVSSIVTTFTIPIFLKMAIRTFLDHTGDVNENAESNNNSTPVDIDIAQIIRNIALLTLFPVVVGMVVRHVKSSLADRMERPLKILAGLLLTAIVVAAIVSFWTLVQEAIGTVAAPTTLLIACMMTLSYTTAWALRLEHRQRITICVESSIQYSGLAITIGLTMLDTVRDDATGRIVFDPQEVIMPAAVYTIFMYPVGVGVILFCWWWRGVLRFNTSCKETDANEDDNDDDKSEEPDSAADDGDDDALENSRGTIQSETGDSGAH